ncbi:SIR2 family protein [Rhizobium ruizarguesonis]|nr:SIR2 family protein [Rhizobium ruizarguesonis]
MLDRESWKNRSNVTRFLSERLSSGHVMPFLGSGVSYFAQLPSWKNLISDVAKQKNDAFSLPTEFEPYILAQQILDSLYGGDKQEFYFAVHKGLYGGKDLSALHSLILADPGLRALTMLCNRSVRGGSRFIFTLNYDNILEILLRDLGLVVKSVGEDRFLFDDADVSVFHPHGLLPIDDVGKALERKIVITQSDGQHVSKTSWKPLLEVLLSKSFPVFIGVGGNSDLRFLDYLDDAGEHNYLHASRAYPFIGIRLCSANDPSIAMFENKRIKCIGFEDLGKGWPSFVEDVCRLSAAKAAQRLSL